MLAANVITMVAIGAYSLLMQGLLWDRLVFLYAMPAAALGAMVALDLALAARLGAFLRAQWALAARYAVVRRQADRARARNGRAGDRPAAVPAGGS